MGLNLNKELDFDEKGIRCNKTLNISWSEVVRRLDYWDGDVQQCDIKSGSGTIERTSLWRLLVKDFGFQGRKWYTEEFRSHPNL